MKSGAVTDNFWHATDILYILYVYSQASNLTYATACQHEPVLCWVHVYAYAARSTPNIFV
jgi:hypothetical protein